MMIPGTKHSSAPYLVSDLCELTAHPHGVKHTKFLVSLQRNSRKNKGEGTVGIRKKGLEVKGERKLENGGEDGNRKEVRAADEVA